jgi:acyl carrier protein
MDAKTVVLDFLEANAKAPLPARDDPALLACSYLDIGVIDSLGIVTMITEFEDALSISFTAEDMQSYEFLTVGGLIDLVERKLAQKR